MSGSFGDVEAWVQALIMATYLVGVIALTFLTARRLPTSWRALVTLRWMRIVVSALMVSS